LGRLLVSASFRSLRARRHFHKGCLISSSPGDLRAALPSASLGHASVLSRSPLLVIETCRLADRSGLPCSKFLVFLFLSVCGGCWVCGVGVFGVWGGLFGLGGLWVFWFLFFFSLFVVLGGFWGGDLGVSCF